MFAHRKNRKPRHGNPLGLAVESLEDRRFLTGGLNLGIAFAPATEQVHAPLDPIGAMLVNSPTTVDACGQTKECQELSLVHAVFETTEKGDDGGGDTDPPDCIIWDILGAPARSLGV